MANANTIRRQVGGSNTGNQQLTLAAIVNPGTTKTAFVLNNNGLTGQGGGVVPIPAGNYGIVQGQGQIIHVRANGTYSGVTSGTTTIALELYEVPFSVIAAGGLTQTSFTGYNAVGTITSTAVTSASGSFSVDAYLQLDANGNLTGTIEGDIDGVWVGPTAITTITGLVGPAVNGDTGAVSTQYQGENDLNFVLAVTLGGAEPTTSTLVLNEFAIDVA